MKEIWKNIEGFESRYQVSSFGRVRSLARIRGANVGGSYFQKQKILKLVEKNTGYAQVNLPKNGKWKVYLVHRIVAHHFIPLIHGKIQVNHKNGVKTDNRVENLEWCTPSENGLHSYKVLKNTIWQKGKKGEYTPTAKPVLQKSLLGKLIKRWGCGLDAVRDGGFDSSCISRCCSGKSKSHKGFIWEYEK